VIVSRINDLLGGKLDTIFNLPGRYEELAGELPFPRLLKEIMNSRCTEMSKAQRHELLYPHHFGKSPQFCLGLKELTLAHGLLASSGKLNFHATGWLA
jgi:hypothetical protein